MLVSTVAGTRDASSTRNRRILCFRQDGRTDKTTVSSLDTNIAACVVARLWVLSTAKKSAFDKKQTEYKQNVQAPFALCRCLRLTTDECAWGDTGTKVSHRRRVFSLQAKHAWGKKSNQPRYNVFSRSSYTARTHFPRAIPVADAQKRSIMIKLNTDCGKDGRE